MLNPKCIEVFLAIVKHKSISGVARATYFSQPTVSEYLNQLENELGTALVLRGKGQRQITLTPAGEAFLPLAQKWMDQQRELETMIRQFSRSRQHNTLRLAASSGAHQTVVSNIAYKLIACCLGLNLQLCNMERREIPAAIEAGSFDIAFSFGRIPESELVTIVPLFEEQKFILCPAAGNLPSRVLKPEDLDPEYEVHYTAYREYEPFRNWHRSCFPDTELTAGGLGFSVSSLGSVHHYLTDPRSWTVVPASVALASIAQESERLTFRTVEPAPPGRVCRVLVSKAFREERLIERFFRCCDAFIEERSFLRKIPRGNWENN